MRIQHHHMVTRLNNQITITNEINTQNKARIITANIKDVFVFFSIQLERYLSLTESRHLSTVTSL